MSITVRWEVAFVHDSDAEGILVEVLDEELHAGVPLGVGCGGLRGWRAVLLRAHAHLTEHLSLTWTSQYCIQRFYTKRANTFIFS